MMGINYKDELKNFMDTEGRLKQLPKKHKKRMIVYIYLSSKFEKGRIYTEKEVNRIIDEYHTFGDSCMLRRELYNKRFLNRKRNGSEYWLEEIQPVLED